jgi:hypothetical protein
MNPEFQRNLWLEAGPRRLAWAGVALAAVYGATILLAHRERLGALGVAGVVVFVVAGLLWAPRIAGRAVGDEVADRTWEFQRLSALEPWTMTWGKLFGATSLAWLAALSGLVFITVNVLLRSDAAAAAQTVIGCLAGAVLLQAGSMALALVGVRRARAEGRPAAFRFTFGGFIALFLISGVISRVAPHGGLRGGAALPWLFHRGDQLWWGQSFPAAWFAVFSTAAFAAWALVAAWRLMRLELQMRNAPWAWPAFVVFAGAWAAGFADGAAARWTAAGVVFAICAYAAAFAEPADRIGLRRFGQLVRGRRWAEAALDLPAALAPVLFAAVAVLGLALSPPDMRRAPSAVLALAGFAFMVRDLGVVAFFRFGPRPRRGDFGAVVALFLAYFVGGVVGGGLLVPDPRGTPASALSAAVMAAAVWIFAWRRIQAREASVA